MQTTVRAPIEVVFDVLTDHRAYAGFTPLRSSTLGPTSSCSGSIRTRPPSTHPRPRWPGSGTGPAWCGPGSTGWQTFLQAVREAGFMIGGTWPVRSERTGRTRDIAIAIATSHTRLRLVLALGDEASEATRACA